MTRICFLDLETTGDSARHEPGECADRYLDPPRESALTGRECAALIAFAVGPTVEAAARQMGASARTLRRVQATAARRLGAASVAHAVALAAARGYLDVRHLEAGTLPQWPASPQEQRVAVARATYTQLRGEGVPPEKAAEQAGVSATAARCLDRANRRQIRPTHPRETP